MKEKCDFFICFSAAVNSETREQVAIKKIGNAFDNRVDAKRTLREIMLLGHMDHQNVSFIYYLYISLNIDWPMISFSFLSFFQRKKL